MIIDKIFANCPVIKTTHNYYGNFICYRSTDLIQALFDPVLFSEGTDEADETRTYMMFTQLLTEAEGTY